MASSNNTVVKVSIARIEVDLHYIKSTLDKIALSVTDLNTRINSTANMASDTKIQLDSVTEKLKQIETETSQNSKFISSVKTITTHWRVIITFFGAGTIVNIAVAIASIFLR